MSLLDDPPLPLPLPLPLTRISTLTLPLALFLTPTLTLTLTLTRGLYALEAIDKEDFVCEYIGEYVRNTVAEFREKFYDKMGYGDDYIFRVDAHHLVDATKKGGVARFANHCCDPNCYTRIIRASGRCRIVLYTKRAIEVGEEITYDYKFDLEEDRSNAIPCMCAAGKNCRKFLN